MRFSLWKKKKPPDTPQSLAEVTILIHTPSKLDELFHQSVQDSSFHVKEENADDAEEPVPALSKAAHTEWLILGLYVVRQKVGNKLASKSDRNHLLDGFFNQVYSRMEGNGFSRFEMTIFESDVRMRFSEYDELANGHESLAERAGYHLLAENGAQYLVKFAVIAHVAGHLLAFAELVDRVLCRA
ncbi:MAG: hypothetical protein ACR2JE_14710 [Acidobacteriaceae bacterium]